MRFRTLFLDAGGVLVWPNWRIVADALARHGVRVSADALAAQDARARNAIDRAELVSSTTDQRRGTSFFDLVLTGAGITPSAATAAALAEVQRYHATENLWEVAPPFVPSALRELRSAGYQLVVVSNANGVLHKLFDRLGLSPLVDLALDSHVEGVEKPDPRFFELALERAGADAASTVHVGDFYHIDVEGARRVGITPVLVDEEDLRPDADCARIRTIAELPRLLAHLPS